MGIPDEDLRRRLAELRSTDGGDTPSFSRVVVARKRRERRRKLGGLTVGAVTMLVAILGVTQLPGLNTGDNGAPASDPASPPTTPTTTAPRSPAWETDWMRAVLGSSGTAIIDDTGTALVADSGEETFYAWANEPPATLSDRTREGYEEWATHGDTVVYFDGVRYTWNTDQLTVWIQSASMSQRRPLTLSAGLLKELVHETETTPFPLPSDEPDPTRCDFPSLHPTYLPWVRPVEPIPTPFESYDDEIDRAQLSWRDPRFPPGDAGVALTVYTYFPAGSDDEEINVEVQGVPGYLHRSDDGGTVSINWDLPTSTCNFLELSLAAPALTGSEAVAELLKIARSLEPA